MKETRLLTSLTLTGLVLLTARLSAAPIPEDAKIGGFAIGCQAWTFNRFTAFEAVEKTALAGGKVIEFFPGQKLSPQQPDAKLDHNASDEVLAQVLHAHIRSMLCGRSVTIRVLVRRSVLSEPPSLVRICWTLP